MFSLQTLWTFSQHNSPRSLSVGVVLGQGLEQVCQCTDQVCLPGVHHFGVVCTLCVMELAVSLCVRAYVHVLLGPAVGPGAFSCWLCR
jgi:hypothetical protein